MTPEEKEVKAPKTVDGKVDIKVDQENEIPEIRADRKIANKILKDNYESYLWFQWHW
jgi:hypothetical protein